MKARTNGLALKMVLFLLSLLTIFPVTATAVQADLYVSSRGNNQVLRYDKTTGEFIEIFVSGGELYLPQGLTFGPDGNLYVCSVGNDRVLRYDGKNGSFIDSFVSDGSGGLDSPTGITFGPDGNLYVSSHDTDQVLRFDGKTGAFIDVFASGGGLNGPFGLTFGPDGNLYVVLEGTAPGAVLRYNGTNGAFIDAFVPHWSSPLANPISLTFGPGGNLYVSSEGTSQVLRYNGATGGFIDVFVSGVELSRPFGLTFGPDGNLYVSDIEKNIVLRYNGISGTFIDVFAEQGEIQNPTFIAFSPTKILDVEIDIKPGSDPNSINPKSKGKIPVAILSKKDFNAPKMVDWESLTFGSTGDEDSLAFCNPKGENINGDGLKDLVCHFYTQVAGFQCGDTEGVLKGETVDGKPIEGIDSVRINPCKK